MGCCGIPGGKNINNNQKLLFRFQSKFTENVGDKSKLMYKLSLFDINETQVHYTYNHWM